MRRQNLRRASAVRRPDRSSQSIAQVPPGILPAPWPSPGHQGALANRPLYPSSGMLRSPRHRLAGINCILIAFITSMNEGTPCIVSRLYMRKISTPPCPASGHHPVATLQPAVICQVNQCRNLAFPGKPEASGNVRFLTRMRYFRAFRPDLTKQDPGPLRLLGDRLRSLGSSRKSKS